MPSPRSSCAPSLAARERPPGPLGAARRPGGGRCGAQGRWRLRRRRRAPHSVGPLSCPRLRDTPLGAGGRPPRTPSRPSRFSAALRPSAPPCGPGRRAPLRSLARPAPARCPARAAPCLARALLGPPAGPLPGPAGFARASPFAGAGPGPAALQLLVRGSRSSGSGGPPGSRRRHRRRTRTPGFT